MVKLKVMCLLVLSVLTSCQALPQMFQTVDDIATDGVISIDVDKEAFRGDTNVKINVDISNKTIKQSS